MKRTAALLVLLSGSFATLACGVSPLLNHVQASPLHEQGPVDRAQGTVNCPLDFPKSGLCASLTWESAPNSESESSATLKFWDKTSATAQGPYRSVEGDVAVLLWMPSMGHGSSPVTVQPQADGVYSASRIFFIMPGQWEVRVQIKKNQALFEQAVLPVQL